MEISGLLVHSKISPRDRPGILAWASVQFLIRQKQGQRKTMHILGELKFEEVKRIQAPYWSSMASKASISAGDLALSICADSCQVRPRKSALLCLQCLVDLGYFPRALPR